ncbi:hypothetical protein llap_7501 [Limosa lapponica baueri]|uniref:Rna-directed dna polymerase from mobile element jockey-like n=1 Tax=Limosa lapponica baueri TaxID=1758121 RepID=A0A2I0U836_LIMLA|nr:hypothetical protein llap_7501 [Limosa lapponica baueri]
MEKVQQRATKKIKGLEHLFHEESLRAGTVQPREENAQKDLINVHTYLKQGCKEDGSRLFLIVPSDRTRDNGRKLKQRVVHMNIRKHFIFQSEGDQVLAQVFQRDCAVSILEDIPKPSRHGPGQLGLGDPD